MLKITEKEYYLTDAMGRTVAIKDLQHNSWEYYLSVDPLAVQFPSWSTYNYVMGNPIMLIDPTGKKTEGWIKQDNDGKKTYTYDQNVNSTEEANAAGYQNVEGGTAQLFRSSG